MIYGYGKLQQVVRHVTPNKQPNQVIGESDVAVLVRLTSHALLNNRVKRGKF